MDKRIAAMGVTNVEVSCVYEHSLADDLMFYGLSGFNGLFWHKARPVGYKICCMYKLEGNGQGVRGEAQTVDHINN